MDRKKFPADPDPEADGAPRNWPANLVKRGFRLPTEAEWETVCRGGTNTAYSFGNDERLLGRYGWFMESSDKWSHAVGRLRPSARGLYDIHGNLHEWCHDWIGDYRIESGVEDPSGPAAGSTRVHRGGGWYDVAGYCRSADRVYSQPAIRDNTVGFRVAVVPSSQASESGSQEAGGGSRDAE